MNTVLKHMIFVVWVNIALVIPANAGLFDDLQKDLQKIRKVFVTRDARHSPRLVRLPSFGRSELEYTRKKSMLPCYLSPGK